MMTQREALEVLAAERRERIVVTTMSSVGIWPTLSDGPKDFDYLPSSMGQGISIALGLALAKPGLGVISVMGDGSLLMNLGSLITVASHPANLAIILLDNGLYEVTGGQPVANAGRTDFAGMARAAGIPHVFAFDDLEQWKQHAGQIIAGPGPSFTWLKVQARYGQKTPLPPRPMAEQIQRLRGAIGN